MAVYVTNKWGQKINYIVVCNFMDERLSDEIFMELNDLSPQNFFNEYCRRHKDYFGTEFKLNRKSYATDDTED